jgi:hypothetical protein
MAATTGNVEADRREAVRLRLRNDLIYYAENAVWIANKQGDVVPFKLRRPQRRLARALMAQRDAGIPMRAVLLKARQVGMSTFSQAVIIQRVTQQSNHTAMVLATDRDTAGNLFSIGEGMYARLPAEIRPPVASQSGTQDRKHMTFGEPSRQLRREGVLGLNSRITMATPAGLSGRSRTIRTLHISEYAHWPMSDKLLAVVNGVPDDPDSLILNESTPLGHNHFKDAWDLAVSGESGYIPFFTPWYEDGEYRRPFPNDAELEAFVPGDHPKYGGDEEADLYLQLREDIAAWMTEEGERFTDATLELLVLEHLNWRRWAIPAKAEGSLEKFHQEYPSNPDEAFLATGNRVFDAKIVAGVIKRCETESDPPVRSIDVPGPVVGLLRPAETKKVIDRMKQKIDVPTSVEWVSRSKIDRAAGEVARWRLWEMPQKGHEHNGEWVPDGQYIVFCDPASGDEDEKGLHRAQHAISVIDHRTRRQVAEWAGQLDTDLCALELLKIALFFNNAWINVEKTGGWGLPMLRKLRGDWHYVRIWTDESLDKRTTSYNDRLGWDTNSVSKPLMEAEAIELLRIEKDGIRSLELARQMLWFVRDKRGKSGPEPGKLSDRLMAWMGAQITAKLRPIRPDAGPRSGAKKKAGNRRRRPRNPKTGY